MSPARIVAFSGNVHRPSRTRSLVETIGKEAARLSSGTLELLDLLDAPGIGQAYGPKQLDEASRRLIDAIEGADALVVGSPVYKGAYTGLFKHVFDLVGPGALDGKPVVLAATGGGLRHALVVEHQLRPLFGFFGASSVATAVYASDAEIVDGRLHEPDVLKRALLAGKQLAKQLETAITAEDAILHRLAQANVA